MGDEADIAFVNEQLARDSAVEVSRKCHNRLHPIGECHFCQGTVGALQLFCDSDCSADWEKETRLKKQAGLPATALTH